MSPWQGGAGVRLSHPGEGAAAVAGCDHWENSEAEGSSLVERVGVGCKAQDTASRGGGSCLVGLQGMGGRLWS